MARVTVEDCVEKVPSRYELVALAARRAKDISAGAPITLSRDNDKDAVIALREIAEETINLDDLRENVVQSFQQRMAMERFVEREDDSRSREISDAFAAEAASLAEEMDEESMDEAGLSFSGEDVQVDD